MDRVVLNKILDCDYTLSNIFMRTCKKFNRYIHDNSKIMEKLSHRYQPKIEKEIQFGLCRLFSHYGYTPPSKHIANILINNSSGSKKTLKQNDVKISEVILLDSKGCVLKSFTMKSVESLFKTNVDELNEISRLRNMYQHSVGYRINKNEASIITLLDNFSILLNTIVRENKLKCDELSRFPANTYLKYFILMIAVLYIRYTFMK
jgi:hypothetical protein